MNRAATATPLPDRARLPDYRGGSTLNLLASIIRALGGRSPHPDLRCLPSSALAACRRIVLLVIDGLGEAQLARYLARRPVPGHPFGQTHPVIDAAFPATTAAAATTLLTGASPAEHGILGWHLHLRSAGAVSTILRATTRTGMPLFPADFDLRGFLAIPSHVDTIPAPRELISYDFIPASRYSRAVGHWDRVRGCRTEAELTDALIEAIQRRSPGFVHAYWPAYDAACHDHGTSHEQADRVLDRIAEAIAPAADAARRVGVALLATADHGLYDVRPGDCIDLSRVDGLLDCLATLPAGDAGHAMCYVRPARVEAFQSIVHGALARHAVAVPGDELLRAGWFGPGQPHPDLAGRVGDWVLLARPGCALLSSAPAQPVAPLAAVHGGALIEEIQVPLLNLGAMP